MTSPKKVVFKRLAAEHQEESFTCYLPLPAPMVLEIGQAVGEVFDRLGGRSLLRSSRDVFIKPNGIDAKASP